MSSISIKLIRQVNSPLRILQFVPEKLPTYRADVVTLFGKYLPQFGIFCDIVGKSDGKPLPPSQGFASILRVASKGGRLRTELRFLRVCVSAALAAKSKGCAAIQARDMVTVGFFTMLAARICNVPFLYWMSFPMCEARIVRARESTGLRSRIVLTKGLVEQWVLYRLVLPAAQHVFVQSNAMSEMVQAKGISAHKITAVPMGVDMEMIEAPAIATNLSNAAPRIAYLGTLDRLRKLDVLIDTLQLVRQRHPNAELLLIGDADPPDTAALKKYASELGLQQAVTITGWLPSTEAWRMLRGADVAVSYVPRGQIYDVSSPTKLLEYMALAMPSVGNDIPDQALVLRSSNAGWLTGSTPTELAAALCEILDNPKRAQERASAGPAYIRSARSYHVLAEQLANRYYTSLRSDR